MDAKTKSRGILKSGLAHSIYPEYLLKNCNLSNEEGLKICNELQNEGLLLPMYEVRCTECVKQLGIFETFNNASNIKECIYCNRDFEDSIGNISVYFKVLNS